MGMGDLFKKSEETKSEEKVEPTKPEEKLDPVEEVEDEFEATSKKLREAVETARDGQDLGDIPARDDHPYHVAVREHRLHEAKRKL